MLNLRLVILDDCYIRVVKPSWNIQGLQKMGLISFEYIYWLTVSIKLLNVSLIGISIMPRKLHLCIFTSKWQGSILLFFWSLLKVFYRAWVWLGTANAPTPHFSVPLDGMLLMASLSLRASQTSTRWSTHIIASFYSSSSSVLWEEPRCSNLLVFSPGSLQLLAKV